MKRGKVVVVLSTPLTLLENGIFLSERAHVQTLELLADRFEEVLVVARCRTVAVMADREHVALEATGARLALELLDYGGAGAGRKLLSFLISPRRRQQISAVIRGAELLYVESPSLESILVSSLGARRGIPYIVEMRGDTMLNPLYTRSRLGVVGPLVSSAMRLLSSAFRAGAAGAVFVGEELRSRYAPPGAITVAVSSVRLPPGCPKPPRQPDAPARRFLYVGHLEKVKSLDTVLDALHRVTDQLASGWQLDIVGDGPERALLEARAAALGMADHVHFHRRVPWGDELFHYYETADLLLMSSLTEGNSRTLLEGMSYGLPAISSAVGEAPRLLTSDALVPPGDTDALASALPRIANDVRRLAALSAHNVQQSAHYSPADLRRRRALFFDTVIARIRSGAGAYMMPTPRTT